jgi:hypothetical protein
VKTSYMTSGATSTRPGKVFGSQQNKSILLARYEYGRDGDQVFSDLFEPSRQRLPPEDLARKGPITLVAQSGTLEAKDEGLGALWPTGKQFVEPRP